MDKERFKKIIDSYKNDVDDIEKAKKYIRILEETSAGLLRTLSNGGVLLMKANMQKTALWDFTFKEMEIPENKFQEYFQDNLEKYFIETVNSSAMSREIFLESKDQDWLHYYDQLVKAGKIKPIEI
ncbi:MAG: hypothetical protein JXA60_01390 [Candidatus Coatesbacteria bacterium]|nr:hypothetical protein [Candidatus Coatesbacteria bacterium]